MKPKNSHSKQHFRTKDTLATVFLWQNISTFQFMPLFKPFEYIADFQYDNGWDKYALKYATLLQKDTLYYLHKQVLYDYMEHSILPHLGGNLNILDVNCGTGNDFPFLLSKGKVTGIDGSAGMLNKAAETYSSAIDNGSLKLYQGMTQDLTPESLNGERFDIIYSITGGFSYINDEQFGKSFKVLQSMLRPGGVIITAHLNTFCLAETIACLWKGRFKRSLLRLKKTIPNIHGASMHLRSKKDLKRLLDPIFDKTEYLPLIAIAPPYQTDVVLKPETVKKLRKVENWMVAHKLGNLWADQIVAVSRN
ncbi:MAG: class I SAM-dependent methyltransferase [Flavipsychrobacter sp.]